MWCIDFQDTVKATHDKTRQAIAPAHGAHSNCSGLRGASAALHLLLKHKGVKAPLEHILVLLPLKLRLVLALELGRQILCVPSAASTDVSTCVACCTDLF